MPPRRRAANLGFCNGCDEPFKDGDSWIQCAACTKWLHRKCTDLNDLQFDAMVDTSKQQKQKNSLKFFCELCDGTVTDILSNFQKYKKMENELKKVRVEIDSKIEEFNSRLMKCEASQNQTVTLAERVKKKSKLTKTTPTVEIRNLEEEREIERRKCNLIIYGVPEPTSAELEDKLEEEYAYICEAYKKTVSFERGHIKDMFRLGKKQQEKDRPLLIKFHDEDSKMEVLKASGDLKLKINHEVIKVYAANDMTQKQRSEFKKLKQELKTRKDNGEEDIGIRGNKVVKLQLFRKRQANRTRIIWASNIKKRETSKQGTELTEQEEPK